MEERRLTKSGRVMKAMIAERIVEVLANPLNDGKSQLALAKLARVSGRTLREYTTPELRADVAALRQRWLTPHALIDVDRAMLAKAREGNVAAARLIYLRLASVDKGSDELPTLEELEAELLELKGRETP